MIGGSQFPVADNGQNNQQTRGGRAQESGQQTTIRAKKKENTTRFIQRVHTSQVQVQRLIFSLGGRTCKNATVKIGSRKCEARSSQQTAAFEAHFLNKVDFEQLLSQLAMVDPVVTDGEISPKKRRIRLPIIA